MPRDSGKTYSGTLKGHGGGSGTATVTIEGTTYTGTAVVVSSIESFGFSTSYGFPAKASDLRYKGYLSALEEVGERPHSEFLALGAHGEETAHALTLELLALPRPPTAIFAMSDLQAVGCLRAIREANLRVPDDISVIGFDDVQFSRYVGLTTIRQHLELSGDLGMQLLVEMIANPELVTAPVLPPLELVIRSTTGPTEARTRSADQTGHSQLSY